MIEKVKVELLTRIANKGKQGDIIEVSRAEARNFMIPKWIAREVNVQRMKEIEARWKREGDIARMAIEEIYALRDALHGHTLMFDLTGSEKRVFGGVGEKEIVDALKKQYHVTFEKKHIKIATWHRLKEVGVYDIVINLGREVYIKIYVELRSKPHEMNKK